MQRKDKDDEEKGGGMLPIVLAIVVIMMIIFIGTRGSSSWGSCAEESEQTPKPFVRCQDSVPSKKSGLCWSRDQKLVVESGVAICRCKE